MSDTAEIAESLVRLGLADDPAGLSFHPLTGGVSSDIWRVTGGHRTICVKRARDRLAVEAEWKVPVERNHFEAEFLRVASDEAPGFAPDLLAEDADLGLLVQSYYDPAEWHLWKPRLLAGDVDPATARAVGTHLGRLARATRGRPDLARRFDTDALFDAIRLDPYLRECARRHPDLAPALTHLIETTKAHKETLVHGDVSPKNILVSDNKSPVILDAECAWFGDPAFDLAFMMNHLLLKSVYQPVAAPLLRAGLEQLVKGRAEADAPDHAAVVEARATALLPGLLLARVDGKSPVEYLTDPMKQALVRSVARRFLLDPATDPLEIADTLTESSPT